ncbi:hypothetical protein WOLCODRAFT_142501 [Wolfiporia cocos MD-104 SS10]|uniref:Uncharacterized protein n=1 Tax=Wolfiporia cocos (strain MD-104) TaxID=742152 RepID=A0A2H3JQM9_WOLCO|nr:hypothetical protein WOLCODRAFT_142501 [Wolfiporia cocos MD-104 SS10]
MFKFANACRYVHPAPAHILMRPYPFQAPRRTTSGPAVPKFRYARSPARLLPYGSDKIAPWATPDARALPTW